MDARMFGMTISFSLLVVMHCEKWLASKVAGPRFFAAFNCALGYLVLRFRHGQRIVDVRVRDQPGAVLPGKEEQPALQLRFRESNRLHRSL